MTYKDTLMEIVDVKLLFGQEVLDIITEGLGVFLFLTILHGLDEGALRDGHH